MNLYSYKGPVYIFNDLVNSEWSSSTRAKNEKCAKRNLTYQYKKTHNLSSDTRVTLKNNVYLEEE